MKFRNSDDIIIKIQEFITEKAESKRRLRGIIRFILSSDSFREVSELVKEYNKLCKDKRLLFKEKVRNSSDILNRTIIWSREDFEIAESTKKTVKRLSPKIDSSITTSIFNIFFSNKRLNKTSTFKRNSDSIDEVNSLVINVIKKKAKLKEVDSDTIKQYLLKLKTYQNTFNSNYRFLSIVADKNIDKDLTLVIKNILISLEKAGIKIDKNTIFAYNNKRKSLIIRELKNSLKSKSSSELINTLNSLSIKKELIGIGIDSKKIKSRTTTTISKKQDISSSEVTFQKNSSKSVESLEYKMNIVETSNSTKRRIQGLCKVSIEKDNIIFSFSRNREIKTLNLKESQEAIKKLGLRSIKVDIQRGIFKSNVIQDLNKKIEKLFRGSKNKFLEELYLKIANNSLGISRS